MEYTAYTEWEPSGSKITKRERQELAAEGLKFCPGCKTIKPTEDFYQCHSKVDGRFPVCADCQRRRAAKSYARRKAADRSVEDAVTAA